MLWIIGKPFENFARYLTDSGVSFGILWDSRNKPGHFDVPVITLDFSKPSTLIEQLNKHSDSIITALATEYERYIRPGASLAQHFSVPFLSPEAAAVATDKSLMRGRLATHEPALTPGYSVVSNWEEVETFMASHGFPVMLKPASLMKSLLITKNASLEELKHNFEEAQSEIGKLYQKQHIDQPPTLIIEEFLEGSMHTVAGFVDTAGEPQLIPYITDCITAQEIGKADNHLFSRQLPTVLSDADQAAVLEATAAAIKAFGYSSCAVHAEIILTKQGPKIIEIGARLGGYRQRMYSQAYGIDLYDNLVRISKNEPVDFTPTHTSACAVLEIFPESEGTLVSMPPAEQLKSLASFTELRQKAQPGDAVGRASHGYKASYIVLLAHADIDILAADIAYIKNLPKLAVS